jgi:hypothetical protein
VVEEVWKMEQPLRKANPMAAPTTRVRRRILLILA